MNVRSLDLLARSVLAKRLCRYQSTLAAKQHKESSEYKDVLPFEKIPEVKGLPFIGTLLDYTPMRGFKISHMFELWEKRHQEYGDIYKEKVLNKYQVCCRSREDTETMVRLDGRMPMREPQHEMTELKKRMGMADSIINMNGEEWVRLRRQINDGLLKHKSVWKFADDQHDIAKELVAYISRNLDKSGEVPDFQQALDAWALENAITFTLSKKLGLLDETVPSEFAEVRQGVGMLMQHLADYAMPKPFGKKRTQEVAQNLCRVREIFNNMIEEKRESGELHATFIGSILDNLKLTKTEALSLVFDILSAGVETTSKSSVFLLYCLAIHPEVQEKLRLEILELEENKDVTGRSTEAMKYMNAFIKETSRLYPFVVGHARTYQHDMVLSGYRIPAGITVNNTSNTTQNKNPDYFDEPEKFKPERWMEETGRTNKFNLTGPFGVGARACAGRRFAMQEMRFLIFEVLKNFKIEYHYKPMMSIFRLTGYPSEKPRFTFIPLK